jgi:3-deoxy-7-phosphoheptulonate synthase
VPGEAEAETSAFLFPVRPSKEGRSMFVVMARTATEAEILGVKSHILAEGMTPYDHAGQERVVIAVVGEVGPLKQVLASRLAALPGVETITPISRPFKLTSREFHPEDTVIRVLDAIVGDGGLTVMARPARSRP